MIQQLQTQAAEKLCELLNEQINQHGEIQKSNKTIWSVLHQTDNDIWLNLIAGILSITPTTHRNSQRIEQRAAELSQAIDALGSKYPNVITPYPAEYKKQKRPATELFQNAAWHLLMMTREVYCDTHGIHLPNADSSKGLLDEDTIQIQ
jgi:hypothetical protein